MSNRVNPFKKLVFHFYSTGGATFTKLHSFTRLPPEGAESSLPDDYEVANQLVKSKADMTLDDENFGHFDIFTGSSIRGVDMYGYTYDPLCHTISEKVYTLYTYRIHSKELKNWDFPEDDVLSNSDSDSGDSDLSVDTFLIHCTGDDDVTGSKPGKKGSRSFLPRPRYVRPGVTTQKSRNPNRTTEPRTSPQTTDHRQERKTTEFDRQTTLRFSNTNKKSHIPTTMKTPSGFRPRHPSTEHTESYKDADEREKLTLRMRPGAGDNSGSSPELEEKIVLGNKDQLIFSTYTYGSGKEGISEGRTTNNGDATREDEDKTAEYRNRTTEDGGRTVKDGGRFEEDEDRTTEDGGRTPKDGDMTTDDTEKTTEGGGGTTEKVGRTTEDGSRTTKEGGRTTEDGGRTEEDGDITTEDRDRSTEEGGRTAEDGDMTTDDTEKTTEGGDGTTEKVGRTTEDGSRTTKEKGSTTEDGGRTEEDGDITTEDGDRSTEEGGRTAEDGDVTTENTGRTVTDGKRAPEGGEKIPSNKGGITENGGRNKEDGEATTGEKEKITQDVTKTEKDGQRTTNNGERTAGDGEWMPADREKTTVGEERTKTAERTIKEEREKIARDGRTTRDKYRTIENGERILGNKEKTVEHPERISGDEERTTEDGRNGTKGRSRTVEDSRRGTEDEKIKVEITRARDDRGQATGEEKSTVSGGVGIGEDGAHHRWEIESGDTANFADITDCSFGDSSFWRWWGHGRQQGYDLIWKDHVQETRAPRESATTATQTEFDMLSEFMPEYEEFVRYKRMALGAHGQGRVLPWHSFQLGLTEDPEDTEGLLPTGTAGLEKTSIDGVEAAGSSTRKDKDGLKKNKGMSTREKEMTVAQPNASKDSVTESEKESSTSSKEKVSVSTEGAAESAVSFAADNAYRAYLATTHTNTRVTITNEWQHSTWAGSAYESDSSVVDGVAGGQSSGARRGGPHASLVDQAVQTMDTGSTRVLLHGHSASSSAGAMVSVRGSGTEIGTGGFSTTRGSKESWEAGVDQEEVSGVAIITKDAGGRGKRGFCCRVCCAALPMQALLLLLLGAACLLPMSEEEYGCIWANFQNSGFMMLRYHDGHPPF